MPLNSPMVFFVNLSFHVNLLCFYDIACGLFSIALWLCILDCLRFSCNAHYDNTRREVCILLPLDIVCSTVL